MSASPRAGLSVVPVLLIVALALAVGSAGTAAAGVLTKGTVKKIAAKVVKKQAPSLSVKHATTADSALTAQNAEKIGGATAAQLGVRPLVYTLTSGAFTHSAALDLPGVPAGSYLVGFSAGADSGTRLNCTVKNVTTNRIAATNNQPQTDPTIPLCSGSGFLTVSAGDQVRFFCDSDVDLLVPAAVPWTVTLTPTTSTTEKAMTPVP